MSTTMAVKAWTRSGFACRITLLVDMSSEVTHSISRLRANIVRSEIIVASVCCCRHCTYDNGLTTHIRTRRTATDTLCLSLVRTPDDDACFSPGYQRELRRFYYLARAARGKVGRSHPPLIARKGAPVRWVSSSSRLRPSAGQRLWRRPAPG